MDAEWKSSDSFEPGESLFAKTHLKLTAGLAEITFDSGARVILEGPADLELVSTDSAHLHSGRLVGRVPPEASGFAVKTPSTTVVDIGTEFGLQVAQSGTAEVIVFEGEVDVERPSNEDPEGAAIRRGPKAVHIRQYRRPLPWKPQ